MPYIYLFTIQNLTCHSATRNYAFISKPMQNKLDKLIEGDMTGCFNQFGLKKDLIKNKTVVEFPLEIFSEIKSNYKGNIKVIKEGGCLYCVMDDKKIVIEGCFGSGKDVYENVGIYE